MISFKAFSFNSIFAWIAMFDDIDIVNFCG